ncbi:hypothetical protein NMY22_g18683 [Coprinellus aureogranulatus]|nr:hypothetical protein NMY22_g18683 [Coprinellus aureogranulatus]
MAYTQPHPRQSILSNSSHSSVEHFSPTASSTRFSLPAAPSIHSTLASTPRPASNRVIPNIYDRSINKARASEVSASAYAFLFSEIVQYTQKRVSGIADFERRLNTLGYRVGGRVLELLFWRNESSSKAPKREIRLLPVLIMIQTQVWKAVFGKPADGLEKSSTNVDEYMVIDNDPILERHISVPRDLNQLCCSSFTAGIVEAFLDGLNFPARVTAHHTPNSQHPNKVTILIKLEKPLGPLLSPFHRLGVDMVAINSILVSPPLLNSSCAWSSDLQNLQELYDSPFTGAITTRTATLSGFKEDDSHAVVFSNTSTTALNSYGYSPHPLARYLDWIKQILQNSNVDKPVIISVTSHTGEDLHTLISMIQDFRQETGDNTRICSRVAVELNTSCPNIRNTSPSGYAFRRLKPLLQVLANACVKDPSLTIGLKMPPYVYREQFVEALDVLSEVASPPFIAFLTCCNTLGNTLLFPDQVVSPATRDSQFAVPPALGGLSGDAVHALALGNVHTFSKLLRGADAPYPSLSRIRIIGVGGVTSKEAAERMRKAGADAVACATLYGRDGVRAFETLSS